jgi:hypothetical protein
MSWLAAASGRLSEGTSHGVLSMQTATPTTSMVLEGMAEQIVERT